MADPVTDPHLLAILNGSGQPVTDPGLLKQLNNMKSGAAGLATPSGGLEVPEAPLSGTETAKGAARAFAGGVPIAGPSLEYNLPAAVSSAFGGGPYAENKEAGKRAQAEFERRFPKESYGLGMAGGVAGTGIGMAVAPSAFGMTGLGTAANITAGGTGGALIGGADAWARGESPVGGAVAGGLLGAGAPAFARGIGATAEGIGNKILGTGIPPELQGISRNALEWAANAAKADGLTDAQITAKFQQLGPQGFLAEYGPNLRGLAGSVAASSGSGKAAIFDAMETRAEAGRQRVEDAVTAIAGPRINMADLSRSSIEARAQASDPLFTAWRATKVFPTPQLKQIAAQLDAAGVLHAADRKMAMQGTPATSKFFMTGKIAPGYPDHSSLTAESWDYAKRALDDQIGAAKRSGNNDDARILTGLKSRLLNAIDNHPDPNVRGVWKAARDEFATHSGIMDARSEGQNVFNPKVRSDELAYQLTDYSGPEREGHRQGARDAIAMLMDHSTRGPTEELRAGAFNKLMDPEGQRKLHLLFDRNGPSGPISADTLIDQLKREMKFTETHNKTIHNSETEARRAMKEMITPDPKDTFIHRVREWYSPHVTPGGVIPPVFERHATERQSQKFEDARDALAPLLVRQGGDAERMARALIGYRPGGNISPSVTRIATALLQGATPEARRKLMEIVQ